MKTSELILAAKDHIADPNMWWKGSFAKNGRGTTGVKEGQPCCAWGALIWAEPDEILLDGINPYIRAYYFISEKTGSIAVFNDAPTTTHSDVLALFQSAVEHFQSIGD